MALKFSTFCNLLSTLEDIAIRNPPYLPAERNERLERETQNWFRSHRRSIDNLDGPSTVALLSSLLPERRTDRVYGIQNVTLAKTLCRSLSLSSARAKDLQAYHIPGHGDLAGCLERILQGGGPPALPIVTVEEVDSVLLGLARSCQFSDPSIRGNSARPESHHPVLGNLFRRMFPNEAKWLVRLILKDFAPVILNERLVLTSLHFLLPDILRFQQDFDAAITTLKGPFKAYPSCPDRQSAHLLRKLVSSSFKPVVGVKVARSAFCKARSIDQCLNITNNRTWMVERKYDGEYCEMHIDLTQGEDWLKMLSKSGKDSTQDRKPIKKILHKCLDIGTTKCKIKQRCILLGEMVVYSDQEKQIMPFHKIRKHVTRSGVFLGTDKDSQRNEHEHLMILFFDLLLLDDTIVMNKPLEDRKALLNGLYKKKQGYAMTVESKVLDFAIPDSKRKLMSHLAASVAARHEGLVLKPCGKPYFSPPGAEAGDSSVCIKLKKDYINGLGDEADFAVIGASYHAQEALRGRLGPSGYTHYHLGCLVNKEQVERFNARPCFKVVGTIAQDQCIPLPILEKIDPLAKILCEPYNPATNPSNFDLEGETVARMNVTFRNPFVFEVLGSSFDKRSNTDYWMLRHPRVRKLHQDRTWRDCVSFGELQDMARLALATPVDSESQENLVWMKKVEESCKRKIARASCQTTPQSKTTVSPTSTRSCRRDPITSPVVPIPVRICAEDFPQMDVTHPQALVSKSHLRPRDDGCALPTPPTSSPLQTMQRSPKRASDTFDDKPTKRVCDGLSRLSDAQTTMSGLPLGHVKVFEDDNQQENDKLQAIANKSAESVGHVRKQQSPLADITHRPRQSLQSSTPLPIPSKRQRNKHTDARYTYSREKPHSSAVFNSHHPQTSPPNMALSQRTAEIPPQHAGTDPLCTYCAILPENSDTVGPICPLQHSVVYFAPTTPHLQSHLRLAALHGATISRSLSEWDRDSYAYAPLTETVSESQSHPGLSKWVLVDTSDIPIALRSTIADVLALNGGRFRERVDFYDIKLLETSCTESGDASEEDGFGSETARAVGLAHLGYVGFDREADEARFVAADDRVEALLEGQVGAGSGAESEQEGMLNGDDSDGDGVDTNRE